MAIRNLIEQSWWRRAGLITLLLLPLSWLYRLIIALRRRLYQAGLLKRYRASSPVIVVGNFTVGGTGKTPIVIALTRALQAAGYIPGIVSRGYRRKNMVDQLVTRDSMPVDVGDEPLLIHAATGAAVAVAVKRSAALALLPPEVNVIISDDGLQHLALARDIEWAVSDSRRYGNAQLLPAGPLREPVRAVDAVLVSSGTVNPGEWGIASQLGEAYPIQDRQASLSLTRFEGKRCAAVAGIGAPERFFEALRMQGIKLAETVPLADHYPYADNPFRALKAEVIFITEKDAVKCASMDSRLWVVPLTAQLPQALLAPLLARLKQWRAPA